MLPYLKHRRVPIIGPILGNLKFLNPPRATRRCGAPCIGGSRRRARSTLRRRQVRRLLSPSATRSGMSLMKSQGLTLDDFAVNHPAGRLGKRLTLKGFEDLMHSGDSNPTIHTEATWTAVVQSISNGGLGAVNVIDDTGQLVGIITDGRKTCAGQFNDAIMLP